MAGSTFDKKPNIHTLVQTVFRSSLYCFMAINVAVFLVDGIIRLFTGLNLSIYLSLIGPVSEWIVRPWGLLTYMFVQSDFLHLLFNMMWLWAFGVIMTREAGGRQLAWTYVICGIAGGAGFLVISSFNSQPVSLLMGSSASVLGIITGAAALQPRMRLNLFLFGEVELRWIALVALFICGIAPGLESVPTLVAHLGGILAGWLCAIIGVRKYPLAHKKLFRTPSK